MADCKYCLAPEPGAPSGLVDLVSRRSSRIYLFPDHRHPGRCVIAARSHTRELFDLGAAQRHRIIDDVSAVAQVVQRVLGADKINVGLYGDIVDHLHAHVVPKFAGGADWGAPFALQGELSDDAALSARLESICTALRAALAALPDPA